MTRRDPNAPNPYYLLAQIREEEMAERARLAARGMAVIAPLHTPSPHLVTAGEEVGAERCAIDLVCRLKVSLRSDTICVVVRERCERRRCQ